MRILTGHRTLPTGVKGVSQERREVKASFGCFIAPKGLANLAQGFNPDHYTQFVGQEAVAQRHYRWMEKQRSPVRTKYRLEAYATLLFGASSDARGHAECSQGNWGFDCFSPIIRPEILLFVL
jgi:hypothetical protein